MSKYSLDDDAGNEIKTNKSLRSRFSRAEVFDMSQLCLNFLLTIGVLIAFLLALQPSDNTTFDTEVSSNETDKYKTCTLDSLGCILDGNVLTFRCNGIRGFFFRTSFIGAEINFGKIRQWENTTQQCYVTLNNHDGNVTLMRSGDLTFTFPLYDVDDMMTGYSRSNLLFNKYTELKFVADNPENWDFKEYMQEHLHETIERAGTQTNNTLFSAIYNLSAPIIFDAVNASDIKYTCFSTSKETDLDFFFRASSYTFIVSIIFMVVQLVAFFIYAWVYDD